MSDVESPLLTPNVPTGKPSPLLQPMNSTPEKLPSFTALDIPNIPPNAPRKKKRDNDNEEFFRKKLFIENLPFDIKCIKNNNYGVITLTPNDIHFVQKRFEITDRLLSGKRPKPLTVNLVGKNQLEQMLYAVMLGDFASIYAAVLTGVNPIAVDLIEKLKAELKK